MKLLKVLNIKEWVLSHVFLIGGLVLLSIGLGSGAIGLTITGIWCIAGGFCFTLRSAFAKLAAK